MDAIKKIKKVLSELLAWRTVTVRWNSPARRSPATGSYILVLQREDGEYVSSPGMFEHGSYWYDVSWLEKPIEQKNILAWSYYPGKP